MRERFPPVTFVSSLVLVVLVASCSRFLQGLHPYWQWTDLPATVALWCQFLVLRVLDEHKDFLEDSRLHPDRVLQRGLITLKDLRWLGAAAFVLTFILSIRVNAELSYALGTWALVQGWVLLMTCEFFCRDFLRRRLFLYSVSHMLVLPLMILWVNALVMAPGQEVRPWLGGLMVFVFINGLIYEVARKFKGHEEENGQLTFTQIWGIRRASWTLAIILILSFSIAVFLGMQVFALSWMVFVPAAVALMLALFGLKKFRFAQDSKNRKLVEGMSALYVLIAYLVYISSLQFQ